MSLSLNRLYNDLKQSGLDPWMKKIFVRFCY
jgi:hypothetical protein